MALSSVTTAPWRPVLGREVAREAFVAVTRSLAGIAPEVLGRGGRLSRSERSLSQGVAGLAVLDRAIRADPLGTDVPPIGPLVVDAAWREIESADRFEVSLFTGHTGLLWTMAHVDDVAAEPVAAAAARLAEGLTTTGARVAMHFDLVIGVTGLLVLGRLVHRRTGDARLLRGVQRRLADTAHRPSVWRTPTGPYRDVPPDVAGAFYCDWGVAHGVPGVVATLARSHLDVGEPESATAHLERFTAARPSVEAGRPLLPLFSGPGGLQFGTADTWCYGDAGAAGVLAAAALATGDPAQRDSAEDYLDAAARSLRRALHHVDRLEPGLCHGVAGVALLAARLHHATGDARFADLATAIVGRALDTGRFEPDRLLRAHGPGLLRGAAGVALALHALLSSSAPEWDMVLALS